MVKKEGMFLAVFIVILVFSIIMIFNQTSKLTGFATTSGTTMSNVTISGYFSITLSDNLTNGIYFGTVNSLPAPNRNATGNNNSATNDANGNTSFFINVSTDSNIGVDFCLRSTADLKTSGGDVIAIGNETYSNSTFVNGTWPALGKEVAFNKTAGIKTGQNVTGGNVTYYRFYLDVPVATPTGSYNNTISFEAVANTNACTL
ncbi:MAG: hypothetical protein NTU63_00920 [Candidatus Pacearchaeota archaeon]|nr:hypothetical protein [Candidatus Pacearchaeota archaeon]